MTTAAKLPQTEPATSALDLEKIRRDFPILARDVRGKRLIYLDNAATSQKPRAVIERIVRYYEQENANIHRGVHFLSELATNEHDHAREAVKNFIHARDTKEIVFVRGTTEAINLVAQTYGRANVAAGDEVVITAMEHHSNIVPWQLLCNEKGAKLRVAPINDDGELLVGELHKMLTPRVKLLALAHVSNALGTINPVKKIINCAHSKNIPVLIDGAQAVPHMKIDVQDLDADFYTLSSHKMLGPMGIGVLYGKAELLEAMPPYQGGGDMISSVTFEKTTYNKLPFKFEAGTPDVAGAIGLGAAIEYLTAIGMDHIEQYEHELLGYAIEKVSEIPGVRLIGTAKEKAGVVSFVIEGVHPHDVGTILDQEGIAIRTGHHCAQPIMDRFGIPATARASFAFYNTKEEVDALANAIRRVQEVFS
ncbi:MAG TPA: cysteine desulfurase [Terriglobales bacterium]|nr:cysteine desulfurase [Terriglobales bacterium]